MLLTAFMSVGLAGKVSLEISEAKTGVKGVFLDFDQTLTIDKLSEEIRQAACQDGAYPECTYLTAGGVGDPDLMITAFESKFGMEDQIESFGGEERLEKIIATLKRLREAGVAVKIVSTSWYPITEEQWQNYLFWVNEKLGLGFEKDEIISLADPGPGKSADKGSKIYDFMKANGMEFDEGMFADDSGSNIASAKEVCNTIHLVVRIGLDDTDRAYIETLAGASPFAMKKSEGKKRPLLGKLMSFFKGKKGKKEVPRGARLVDELRTRTARESQTCSQEFNSRVRSASPKVHAECWDKYKCNDYEPFKCGYQQDYVCGDCGKYNGKPMYCCKGGKTYSRGHPCANVWRRTDVRHHHCSPAY